MLASINKLIYLTPAVLALSIVSLVFTVTSGYSQQDSVIIGNNNDNSLLTNSDISTHSPKKAALMSTILPGLGQVYNKQYWKVPLIYGGFVGFGLMFNFHQSNYNTYKEAYRYRTDNDPNTVDNYVGVASDNDLFEVQKFYRRYRDLAIIGAGLFYILNIVDASVSAHLFTYDVSDDLSLNIQPTINYSTFANQTPVGVALKVNF